VGAFNPPSKQTHANASPQAFHPTLTADRSHGVIVVAESFCQNTFIMCTVDNWALAVLLIPPAVELNLIGTFQQLPDYELAWMREYHFHQRSRVSGNMQQLESFPEYRSVLFNENLLQVDFMYHCDQIEQINTEIQRRII
jgi:hypothetical protein